MNYELAKKLKEAGFPLERFGGKDHKIYLEKNVVYYLPNLSNLIEACGDRFETLNKGKWRGEGKWLAYKNYWDEKHFTQRPQEPIGVGETPEEAVANLWLELNKK